MNNEKNNGVLSWLTGSGNILLTIAVALLAIGYWDLQHRVPDKIPPEWFKSQVSEVRADVKGLERRLLTIERLADTAEAAARAAEKSAEAAAESAKTALAAIEKPDG